MPSIKDLKKRIGTVKNTQQTTKAMKMVSAAKLRRAQDAIVNHRPYAREIQGLIQELLPVTPAIWNEFAGRIASEEDLTRKKKVTLVVVSSDRGLCGGFNTNVIKATQRWIASHAAEYESVDLAFVGKKAYEYFRSRYAVTFYSPEHSGKVSFYKASTVTQLLLERYRSGEADEVKFIYNEFKNAVTQRVMVEDFLPLVFQAPSDNTAEAEEGAPDWIIRPAADEMLRSLLKKNFAVQAYRVLLESQASEHGSRMSAMENATKNAGEMIQKLSLAYNKQRQAGITKELLEIISGSESQKT